MNDTSLLGILLGPVQTFVWSVDPLKRFSHIWILSRHLTLSCPEMPRTQQFRPQISSEICSQRMSNDCNDSNGPKQGLRPIAWMFVVPLDANHPRRPFDSTVNYDVWWMTIHAFDVTLRNTQPRERRIVNLMVIHILREQHTHDILLGSAVSNVYIKQHARAHINVTYENERTQCHHWQEWKDNMDWSLEDTRCRIFFIECWCDQCQCASVGCWMVWGLRFMTWLCGWCLYSDVLSSSNPVPSIIYMYCTYCTEEWRLILSTIKTGIQLRPACMYTDMMKSGMRIPFAYSYINTYICSNCRHTWLVIWRLH